MAATNWNFEGDKSIRNMLCAWAPEGGRVGLSWIYNFDIFFLNVQ